MAKGEMNFEWKGVTTQQIPTRATLTFFFFFFFAFLAPSTLLFFFLFPYPLVFKVSR